MLECAASVIMAIEPVIAPAAILSAIRIEFETIETRTARIFCGAWAAGPMARAGPIIAVPAPSAPAPRGRGG